MANGKRAVGAAVIGAALVPVVLLAGGLLGSLLVFAWLYATGRPWRDIGYVRPRRWWATALGGIALGVALKLLLKIVVLPLLAAPPTNAAYHYLVGNPAALPGIVFTVVVSAGIGEETVWRGYLFERLGHVFGRGAAGRAAVVVIAAAGFALAHLHDQGWPGVEQAAITGLVFGAIFARTGSLAFLMFAHAAFDLLAVAIIYVGLEVRVAHLLFRA
jgi:membrane protease YdiL (CAAX protease family)